jgi:hypothetical protein
MKIFKNLVLLALLSSCSMVNAQQIVLKKNGTLNRYNIDIPNKIYVNYLTDSSINNFKAKVIAYEFPNMTVRVKKDTFIIDVRKITEVIYTSDAVVFYYGTSAIVSILCLPIFIISIHEKIYEAAFASAGLLTGAYFLAKQGDRTFNTKNEWRFE